MSSDAPSFLDTVLITGASSGLGAEFARQLAPVVNHLILVARREDRLQSLSEELFASHPHLAINVVAVDLATTDGRENLFQYLSGREITPTLLINNAGLGDYGTFADSDWAKTQAMIDVNMTALTQLCHQYIPGMKTQGTGAIINVSSLASTLPIPDFAVYAATKSYVSSFSEALRLELAEDSIPVLALCPGPVSTEFGQVAAREEKKFKMSGYNLLYVDKEQVVTEAINALLQNQPRVYPGWKVALLAGAITALPLFAIRAYMSNRPRKSQ